MNKKTFKIILLILFVFFICIIRINGINILAAENNVYTGKCGETLTWSLDTSTGVLCIDGTGEMLNYNSSNAPWREYVVEITRIEISSGVTSIGIYAFSRCTSLESIEIPNSVTRIGSDAFSNSTSLKEIIFEEGSQLTNIGDSAFFVCASLESITIPNGVTSIGSSAFYLCESLKSIEIPNSVTSIGSYAFYKCTSLESITIPNGVTSIGYAAFYGCTSLEYNIYDNGKYLGNEENPYVALIDTVSDDITKIEINPNTKIIYDSALEGCESLESMEIPNSVTSIGSDAFYNCIKLESITIPNSVTSIGEDAFYNCTNLKEVIFEEGSQLTSIGLFAFSGCTSIESITIPNSVTSIGNYAFHNCTSLESITIPFVGNTLNGTSNTHFGYIFGANSFSVNGKYVPSSLKEVIITGVTSIDRYAFDNCTSLESITIPNSVTSIGYDAFYGCTSLEYNIYDNGKYLGNEENPYVVLIDTVSDDITKIEINPNTKIICNSALARCESLESITIPNCVTSIGREAFCNCTSLKEVIFEEGSQLTSIGSSAFSNCESLENVYYNGTIEDWCNIEFDYYYYSNPMSYAEHFYIKDSNNEYYELTELVIPDTITSIGDYQFYGFDNLTKVTIPNSVTSIGVYAFYNCTSLESITIPNSVTKIGSAFENCTNLKEVIFEEGSQLTSIGYDAFRYCESLENVYYKGTIEDWCNIEFYGSYSNPMRYAEHFYIKDSNNEYYELTELVIPNTITSIGDYQFYGFDSLTKVTIPNSVTSIRYDAFYGCTSLESITIPNSVTSIGEDAFYNCTSLENVYYNGTIEDWCNIEFDDFTSNPMSYAEHFYIKDSNNEYYELTELVIPNTITSIGDIVFSNCTSLKEVIFEEGSQLTSIGYGAFYDCTNLKEVIFEEGSQLTSIGNSAFENCTSLTSIEMPNSVTSIGEWAFSKCTSLTSIEIPNSVTSIGSSAFSNCTSLESITIPFVGEVLNGTSNTHFGYIFGAYSYSDNSSYVPTSLKEVIITGGTSIGSSAFRYCTSLTSITIPSSVTSIGEWAFGYCESLESITIPNSVTSIGSSAFSNCTSLESITIPNSVTSIGNSAFYGCTNLKEVIFEEDGQLTSIGEWTFSNCTSLEYNIYDNGKYLGNEENPYVVLIDTVSDDITKIEINPNTKIIYDSALEGCESLECITIPFVGATLDGTSNTHFGYIFGANSYSYNNSYVPTSLKEVIITGSTSISGYAFKNCTSLTSIEIPNSVTSIGYEAFYNCTNLKEVIFEEGSQLTSIGSSAFRYCTSLTSITIPSSVTSIGDGAFGYCESLESIEIPNSVASIGYGAFWECTSLTIYCNVYSKPNSWDKYWNNSNCPVVWGYKSGIVGDLDGNEAVNTSDVIYLLMHTYFPDAYPVEQDCDYTGDGIVNTADVIHLLMHTYFPDAYPIEFKVKKKEDNIIE